MQSQSPANNLGNTAIASGLALTSIALGSSTALAQVTITTTGTLSGTIELPKFNPNFNNRSSRIDTDSKGTYSRHGTPVYTSNGVKVQTRSDGSLHYFVDFKGVPVVSFDGLLSSPVLSGGELTPYNYQGKLPGTKFQGVVQDEFGLTKAFYTGTVTDPKTGQKYEGTFELRGQGPRYSDRNGGKSPTVFDFKSDLPGKPTVTKLKMSNSPLVKLTIKVPADATAINPSGGTKPAPISGGGNTTPKPVPTSNGGVVPTPTPLPINSGGTKTPTPTPVNNGGTTTPTPTPVKISSTTTPTATPVNGITDPTAVAVNSNDKTSLIPDPVAINNDVGTVPTPAPIAINDGVNAQISPTLSPSPEANIEFSNGNAFGMNPVVDSCQKDSINCHSKESSPKSVIGPRSRVLLR